MIGDPSQITYLDLSNLLDTDETFAREALGILARDYARPKSTYTAATSATALLDKWIERGELLCHDERGQVVTDFNPLLYRGDDDWAEAQQSVESGWLIDRASFLQLVDRYGMTEPGAVMFKDERSESSADVSTERPRGVSRTRIIDSFAVRANAKQNRGFWDDKLGRPPGWLVSARVWIGRPGVSSLWNPASVAHALLGHRDMTLASLDRAMKNFPDWEDEWLQQTENDRL